MRVMGIYEYQVCDQNQKGKSYVTVSSNGMVTDGQLITLQNLVHQFQIYNKLKKIHFFRYFSRIKFMNKWNRGSKKAHFIDHKKKISKLLNLQNPRLLRWKTELTSKLLIIENGGWLTGDWTKKVAKRVANMKQQTHVRLAQIAYEMLSKFDLPISESTELMNRVLGNLVALNMTFEKKIRIQRELQTFYRLARYLEFFFFHSIGSFVLQHLESLINKIYDAVQFYKSNILCRLEELDIEKESYLSERQKILVNSPATFEIQFKVIIDNDCNTTIVPGFQDLNTRFASQIKEFIGLVQALDLNFVRNNDFAFVTKNVVKGASQFDEKSLSLRDYLYSVPEYFPLIQDLGIQLQEFNKVAIRRLNLLKPYIENYKKFVGQSKPISCIYDEIVGQIQRIDSALEFNQKIQEGEYFLFGYLSQVEFKDKIRECITQYRNQYLDKVPIMLKGQKQKLYGQVLQHLEIMNLVVNSPSIFIEVSNQCEVLDDLIPQFSLVLTQIQRIQDYYQKVVKSQLPSAFYIKNQLQTLRQKLRNFKQTRENNFAMYRKGLQNSRKSMVDKVQILNLRDESFYSLSPQPGQVYFKICQSLKQLHQVNSQVDKLNQLENFFVLKHTVIPRLEMLIVEYETLQQIWKVYTYWSQTQSEIWMQNAVNVNFRQPMRQLDGGIRKLEKYVKNIQYQQVCKFLIQKVRLYINCLQIIEDLQADHLRIKDYHQVQNMIQKECKVLVDVKTIKVCQIFQHDILTLKNPINQVAFKARKEIQIEEMIEDYKSWWKKLKLQHKELEEYPLIVIFGDNDKVRKQIEQHTTLLLNILNHKYGSFARKECNQLLRMMNNLGNLLELTLIHQEKFLALYPILTSRYAEKQFSNEYKKFDSILHKTMKNVRALIKPTEAINEVTRNLLNNHIKQFDHISKILGEFLEKKRVKFQRFYFLQDDQMLEVLVGIAGESNIFRMFDGIKGWLTNAEGVKYGVEGVGGQQLPLKGWSYKNQQPQIVFKYLEDSIKTTLNSIVRHILFGYEMELKELRNLYENVPWMCVYTVQMVLFTKQIQLNCFQENIPLQVQLGLIQQSINNASAAPMRNSNYITMLLFLHHFTQELMHKEVDSVFRFEWNSFLRYYHDNQCVTMRALGGEHQWGGEYQGLWNLMINTSDIRRAHACVLGNLKYGNGVLLQGPSGTGKTESLKQLARCMAKYCVLSNCSSEINIKTLQKMLSGLCYTASWLCLDQINRLTTEVMSVVANQIITIRNAINVGKEVFNFMGKDIKLKAGVGIFATMNPIYLRRARLTQNLKQYFRVISVNAPDYSKIMEVMLYGLNFTHASTLAKRISKMFKNLSIQLDDHQQYDFGLRAMKFLIHNIHRLRKKTKREEDAVVDGLVQSFYGRLDPQDVSTFEKVINDTFGRNVVFPSEGVSEKLASMIQSPQAGIIVLGPTSTKTTLINLYISKMGGNVNVNRVSPNSMHPKYLMGENVIGRWQQGIVQKIARDSLTESQLMHILILDSLIKSQIIQNFNTLLDDSRILSLPNGTRLKIHNNFKMIMETPDLKSSSPATITRCNVIYVSVKDLSLKQVVKSMLPIQLLGPNKKNIQNILQSLDFSTLLQIQKLYPLLIFPDYEKISWSESHYFGFQKVLIYCIQLLGKQKCIKKFIHKDNAVSARKSIYNFTISFEKYQEGEFIEIHSDLAPIRSHFQVFLPTVESRFYQWVNQRAINQKASLIWTGQANTGKTTSILHSLEGHVYFRLPMTKFMTSHKVLEYLDDKLTSKNQSILKDHSIIYIDNIGMSNQQSSQLFRFLIEHQKAFFHKTSMVLQVSEFTIIAEQNDKNVIDKRLMRHFAEMQVPPSDEISIRSLYTCYFKSIIASTKTSSTFKSSMDIQIDKIGYFLVDYIKKNMTLKNRILGQFHLFPIIKNLQVLSEKNAKQTSDLFLFFFNQLRDSQFEYGQPYGLDLLKLSYNEIFKGKYQEQYINSFIKKSYFTSFLTGTVEKVENGDILKDKITKEVASNLYISDFIVNEVIMIMRTLDWAGGHYHLIAPAGLGKKSIFKIACLISNIDMQGVPQVENANQLPTWVFNTLKRTFQKKKDQVILIDFHEENCDNLLDLIEKITAGHAAKTIFNPECTDYAYVTIQQFIEGSYDKNVRTYDQVIDDYVAASRGRVRLLISSQHHKADKLSNYHYLFKACTKRVLNQFPQESISQISKRVMEIRMQDKTHSNKIVACCLKIYYDIQNLISDNQKAGNFHVKFNQINFFRFMEHYCRLHSKITNRYRQTEDILNRSISKVHQTSQTLQKIKQNLVQMEPEIKEKKQRIVEVVPLLESKKRASQDIKYVVESESREIEFKRAEVSGIMTELEGQIARAQPLLAEANDFISAIKRSQLSQIKNNSNPHPLIRFTLQNLVILLGENESWQNIKRVLSDSNLMMKIKNCSPSQQNYLKVKKRIEENSDWSVDAVSKISIGSRHICKWIVGLVKFSQIKTQVQEKRKTVDSLKVQLHQSQRKAKIKQDQLREREQAVKQIQNEYSKNISQTNRLQEQLEINHERYRNAERIGTNLADSLINWKQKLVGIKEFRNHLQAHVLLICCFLYIYPSLQFEEKEKIDMMIKQNLKKVHLTFDSNFDPFDEVKEYFIPDNKLQPLSYQEINNQKLIQMLYHWEQRPILLDPDGQATKWIQKNYAGKCMTTRESFSSSVKNVQMSIKDGHLLILLVDNEFDKFTTDILNSKISQTANRVLIQYNKNLFYMHPDFRIILCSKLRSPNITTKYIIEHQVINFEVTQKLIKNTLLTEILKLENEDMYSSKITLEIDRRNNEATLKQIDDKVINSLINNKKSLVDDYEFIRLLGQSQMKSDYLRKSANELTQNMLAVQRYLSNYQQLCEDVSIIYSSLKRMSKTSKLLNWSIQIFLQYFLRASSESIAILVQEQDSIIMPNDTNYEFDHYSISMSNSRPTSALSMFSAVTSKHPDDRKDDFEDDVDIIGQFQHLIGMRDSQIDETLKGTMSRQRKQNIINALLNSLKSAFNQEERMIWGMVLILNEENPNDVKMLIESRKKKKLKEHLDQGQVTENIRKYFSRIDKDHQLHALRIVEDVNPFQKYADYFNKVDILLLCKIVKPHNFSDIVTLLIKLKGYSAILQYQQSGVLDWFQKSDNQHPIMLVMGEDPLQRITEYLGRRKYKNVILIAMGEGQNRVAEVVLEKQSRKQNLVILHNLHISQSFYPFLSKTLQQYHVRPPHKNFRLILITSISESFPSTISASCHKYLIQQPSGLKNRMKYLQENIPSQLSFPAHRQVAYSLSLFHSLVNELNKYKPMGWVHNYNFNIADYSYAIKVFKEVVQASLDIKRYECNIDQEQLQNTVNHDMIDFNSLQYLIGDVAYIGKLADQTDRQKMKIFINELITPQILQKNHKFFGLKQYIMPATGDQKGIQLALEMIPQDDSKIFGLHQKLKPIKDSHQFILKRLNETYFIQKKVNKEEQIIHKVIESIFHKLEFINRQIVKFNENPMSDNGPFLREITPITKVFSLKAFSNPRQFFTEIRKEVANKNMVQYDKVEMVWGFTQRQMAYGIVNLKLQGGVIRNNSLEEGYEEHDITLFVYGMVRKKEKQHRKLIQIPLYLNSEREGKINSYGDNTNLLTKVKLQSQYTQEFWTLRGTAFVVM